MMGRGTFRRMRNYLDLNGGWDAFEMQELIGAMGDRRWPGGSAATQSG